ncbi:MAG: hypothetical protein AVDCRST_MAG19-4797 [uncultured Thermomicrobiales bacterium]|uniref:Uncharacterized protein n=1 Tax=uncultured Thermomicrobiales bacterium TaxID=1645740 RepID=A0A6J4VPG5_9BACT|nr:MAG: hypothetical protein AVDCRST_MAG19-4797 [uncultured Thermomicrobiales bacterium]
MAVRRARLDPSDRGGVDTSTAGAPTCGRPRLCDKEDWDASGHAVAGKINGR